MIKQYVRRPIAVEALLVGDNNADEIRNFVSPERLAFPSRTSAGTLCVYLGEYGTAWTGDYIVKEKDGLVIYSEKKFQELYEEVVADLIMEEEAEELENLKNN